MARLLPWEGQGFDVRYYWPYRTRISTCGAQKQQQERKPTLAWQVCCRYPVVSVTHGQLTVLIIWRNTESPAPP